MLVPRAPPRRPLRLPVATIPPPSPCRAVASHAVLLAPRHYASVLSPLQPQPPPPSSSLKQTTFADSFAHRCRRRAYTTSPFINVSDHFAPFTPIASHHGRVMVVNAADLDPELVWQMNLKLIEWDRDKDVNVVIMEKTYPPSGTPFRKKDVIRCHSLLAHRIATMDTPVVSLLEGVCAKEHLSTILHTPFRIATEKTVCSFDQPILPGTSFFLSRLMGGSPLGKYLALTGRPLTGMENVLSGVATHHLPSDRIPALIEHLCTVKTSDLRILDDAIAAFLDASPSLDEWKSWALGGSVGDTINRCFQHDTFTEIVKALEKENTSASKEALDLLEKRSAADLELALKCLSLGSRVDLATSLIADCEALTQGKVTLSAQKRKPTEEDREKHKALVSEATGDLILSSAKTFDYYSFRTVTCLPSEEDVRLVVSGKWR
ncbi:hypothetical protein DFJ73DRAFT_866458 [Zopfochytrium polystomum]|nr:hypothetical protein DFJ73DRAFT_866458 [Zopfochytrium polystomum]